MKVFIDGIIYSLQNYGGISVYFNELLSTLQHENIDYKIQLYSNKKQSPSPAGFELLRDQRWLERYRACRTNSSDLDIFHSSYYRNSDNKKVKNIVTVHDFVYEKYNHCLRKIVHSSQKFSSIKNADRIICISETTKSDLLEFLPKIDESKIDVIYNGVSNNFHPLESINKDQRPFLLFIGNRGGYKNFSATAKALEYLTEFDLICVGGGALAEEELKGLPSSVKVRIKHAGFLNEEDINKLYNQAFCLVYPSSYEGFGIPVAEAMRAGCPVVAYLCSAVIEIGKDALTVVESLDPEIIASGVNKLLSDEYRKSKIATGFSQSRLYDWKKTHDATLDSYRKALGSPN